MIKIEPPEGDGNRYGTGVGYSLPMPSGLTATTAGTQFVACNRGESQRRASTGVTASQRAANQAG